MKLKNLAYATFVAAAAVAFVIGSAVPSEAAKKKKAAAAPPPPPPQVVCAGPTGSGVRNQGRPEVHLSQCLLGREGRRESCQAGCMQSGQGGRRQEKVKEEEGVIRNSV